MYASFFVLFRLYARGLGGHRVTGLIDQTLRRLTFNILAFFRDILSGETHLFMLTTSLHFQGKWIV